MAYRKSLWDGSEPSYAPGLSWSRQYAQWKAPKKYIEAGYSLKTYNLGTGSPDDEHQLERARKCRDLTCEMLDWFEGKARAKIDQRSWKYFFARYLSDEVSTFHEKEQATRNNYLFFINRWEDAIGRDLVENTNYIQITAWRKAMEKNGRSVAYIKRMFTVLRIVSNYAAALELDHGERIATVLSRMTFKTPKRREMYATRLEAYKIIATARREGNKSMALGYIIQFELGLSASDVIGKWVKGTGGITHKDMRWKDGLTWNDVSDNLSTISKGRNKTGADITNYHIDGIKPLVRLLSEVPEHKRAGPLIVAPRTGLPYQSQSWSRGFTRMVAKAGLSGLQNRDLRSGAITEGQQLGASREALQGFANHKNGNTTEIYMRDKDRLANNVIDMRQKGGG